MKLTKLIEKLQDILEKEGDLECTAWQHEEEDERCKSISYAGLFIDKEKKELHIS